MTAQFGGQGGGFGGQGGGQGGGGFGQGGGGGGQNQPTGGGFGGQGGGQGGGGFGGGQGGFGGGQGGGQSQSVGGGFGGQGGQGGGGFGGQGGQGGGGLGGQGGGGFFSIPPQKVVAVPFKSVCLEHGKKTPTFKTKMKIIPTKTYTKDKNLIELIEIVGTTNVNQKALQAAAWHVANKMSWQQLSRKSIQQLGGMGPKAYFSRAELFGANNIVTVAVKRAVEKEKAGDKKEPKKEIPQRRTNRVSIR